jgi:hypothetical protein
MVTFLLQFFTVGSMYASITIFLKQSFSVILAQSGATEMQEKIINSFFDYFYVSLVIMALIISLTTTVDRGVAIFKFLMFLFGTLLCFTMSGIVFFLIKTGFVP